MTATTTSSSSIDDDNSYKPGDVVETSFGVGVIADDDDGGESSSSSFRVMLWRVPGKSIGSCAVAFLQPQAVRTSLFFVCL